MTDPTTAPEVQAAAPEVIAAVETTPVVVPQAPAFGDAEVESTVSKSERTDCRRETDGRGGIVYSGAKHRTIISG